MINKLKNLFAKAKSKTTSLAMASVALVAGPTLATDPASSVHPAATQAMTDLSTQAGEFISMAWPIVATIVGASIGIKLFKRFASKAT